MVEKKEEKQAETPAVPIPIILDAAERKGLEIVVKERDVANDACREVVAAIIRRRNGDPTKDQLFIHDIAKGIVQIQSPAPPPTGPRLVEEKKS